MNHLIFDKGAKNIWRKVTLFNKYCCDICKSACRKLKVDPSLSQCTSNNSKWIKDLNIRPEILTLVQKKAGNTLEAIVIGKDFLSKTQAVQQLKERIHKWDYMKLKTSAQQKKWYLKIEAATHKCLLAIQ
jgi:hypothetical protein